jgi:hypothetical protein
MTDDVSDFGPPLSRLRERAPCVMKLITAANYDEFVDAIECGIDRTAARMTMSRQNFQDLSEDTLTQVMISNLQSVGFFAEHDTQHGGHVDISVQEPADGYAWIAEVKIFKSYGWLLKGFDQLLHRYIPGLEGKDRGELIVYSFAPRIDEMMNKWRDHLRNSREGTEIVEGNNTTVWRSSSIHEAEGREMKVRHKGISLYFDPKTG